jgi:hypothetical protein
MANRAERIAELETAIEAEWSQEYPEHFNPETMGKMVTAEAERRWRADRSYDHTTIERTDRSGTVTADGTHYAIRNFTGNEDDRGTSCWSSTHTYAELLEIRDRINEIEADHVADAADEAERSSDAAWEEWHTSNHVAETE